MFYIEPLQKHHDKKAFDCGNQDLNNYLRTVATQDVRRNFARCYVLTKTTANTEILGFYTLSNTALQRELMEGLGVRAWYEELPMTLVGRLAISKNCIGQGLGSKLLADAFRRSQQSGVGSCGLIVEMKSEELFSFYSHFGFQRLPELPNCAVVFFPGLKIKQSKELTK